MILGIVRPAIFTKLT